MAKDLEEYREKRDFKRTPEPPPKKVVSTGPLTFVVQKHRARQLHYDFRLEVDGVLKSWSVPKGPSFDPEARHLAVMVDDHPLEYSTFEGIIPKGEYGAGEVIVWDSGTYSPDEGGQFLFDDRAAAEEQMRRGLKEGKLSFFLRGSKLKGSWTLVKMQRKENDWLLIKHRDEYAGPGSDILKEEKSVISGRTVEDVRAERSPDKTKDPPLHPKQVTGARPAPYPSTMAPMLASLAEGPFSHPDWIFEPKLDGYRIIALIRDGKVTLQSRRGNKVTEQYDVLVPDLSRQPASELILDGEIIAMDEKGKQCFQCLQNYLKSLGRKESGQSSQYPLIYYVFDILYLDGYDLRGAALRSRKELLSGILRPTSQVRLVDYFEKEGETIYKAAVKSGLEGVVAKKIDSKYESGKRSLNWLKVKAMLSDEFVIGGYSTAAGGRAQTFSSLLLGYFDSKGKLVFAGHVGTGFDEKALGELKKRLDTLRTSRSPFSDVPHLNAPTTWVKPELAAEVKFSEWTQDGRLRIPVFIRLREDKTPEEIHRSKPVTVLAPSRRAKISRQRTKPVTVVDPPPQNKSSQSDSVLDQLQAPEDAFNIEVEGSQISLGHLDKILWPATAGHPGLTKRDLLSYLARVSPYFLPHLKDRPLTLSRYPDGINGEHFWQKHWGHAVPDFVKKVTIKEEKGSRSEYLICDNLATLLWLGQVANIEFHTWFSRISAEPDMAKGKSTDYLLDYPDFIIFDLDPYLYSGKEAKGAEPELNRAGFNKGCEIALWLKAILDELDLKAFVKTSGKTGIHIYVPIKRRLNYKAVRSAAETIGKYLVQKHPEEITTAWAQEKRKGKIFIDYGQNVRGKTVACAYSPRPSPEAAVSTPLRWEELGKVYPTDFTMMTLPDRLKKTGDLWAGILSAKQDLSKLSGTK
jgi:bifunctional non-homologous end joining protein LigD